MPIAELAINSLPNRTTGFSPFFLNFGFHPVVPTDLMKGGEIANLESVNSFIEQLRTVWDLSIKRMKHAQELQARYYDRKHRPIEFHENQLVLLSTVNLRIKGKPTKLKRRFAGPFWVLERIGR